MEYIDENSSQIINEGYKIWKKNVPFLYNVLHSYQLVSCSQSVDWFGENYIDNTYRCMNLLIGTNSLTNNAIHNLNLYVPTQKSLVDFSAYQELYPESQISSKDYVGTMGQQPLSYKNTLYQSAQVMKARISKADPNHENLVAVKVGGPNPELFVYNLNYQQSELEDNKMSLKGHIMEGYGLSWNHLQSNILASCSYDKRLCIYNVDTLQKQVKPILSLETQTVPQQVKWSFVGAQILGITTQSSKIQIYDLREGKDTPAITKTAHNGEIYALDFNKFSQNMLLSGGEEGDIHLWDLRNMSKKLNTFCGHNDAITALQWSPFNPTQFISGSSDRKVIVWEMSQVSSEQGQKPVKNQPGEIKFIHNGHRSKITDIAYASSQKNLIASCEQNNNLQVWQMTESLLS